MMLLLWAAMGNDVVVIHDSPVAPGAQGAVSIGLNMNGGGGDMRKCVWGKQVSNMMVAVTRMILHMK
jgi:hypothetical protein